MQPLSPLLHTELLQRLQQQRDDALGMVRSRAGATPETNASEETESTPLHEIEAAIARLEAGNYGQCSACGAAIDEALLLEQPTRQTCANCLGDT